MESNPDKLPVYFINNSLDHLYLDSTLSVQHDVRTGREIKVNMIQYTFAIVEII